MKKRTLDLWVTSIDVEWDLPAEAMRTLGDCDPDDATPEGLWDVDNRTIYVIGGLSQKRTAAAFAHELMHAVVDIYDQAMEKLT